MHAKGPIVFAAVLTTSLSLIGCSTISPGSFCEIYEPVYVTQQDRDTMDAGTLRAVMGNNAVWQDRCK